jgi:predicted PurR-regulated permease PerM
MAGMLFLGFILSLVARPIFDALGYWPKGKWAIGKSMRAGLAILTFWLLLAGLVLLIGPTVQQQIAALGNIDIEQLSATLQTAFHDLETRMVQQGWLTQNQMASDPNSPLTLALMAQLEQFWMTLRVMDFISPALGAFSSTLAIFFGSLFSAFFLLRDRTLFLEKALQLMPHSWHGHVCNVLIETRKTLSRYFLGLGFELILVASMTTLGLWLVGLNFSMALTLGTTTGILNLIPYLGPLLGFLVGAMLTLATQLHLPFDTEIVPLLFKLCGVYVTVQLIDNFALQPWIYSDSVAAHPLEIFMVIVAGGILGGIPGMMLAVPVYTMIRLVVRRLYEIFRILYRNAHVQTS